MSYSSFKTATVEQTLNVRVVFNPDLFNDVPPVENTEALSKQITENLKVFVYLSEMTRREVIISPVFLRLAQISTVRLRVFSAYAFDWDKSRGLKGVMDYILSAGESVLRADAPIITVVEAKRDNWEEGLGQCVAEALAAHEFNLQEEKQRHEYTYGVITTGTAWVFGRFSAQIFEVNPRELNLDRLDRILGILKFMAENGRG